MSPEPLRDRLKPLPRSPHAATALDRLDEAAARQVSDAGNLLGPGAMREFLGNALGDCPYLLDLSSKDVARLADLLADDPMQRIDREIAALSSQEWETRPEAMRALRQAKQNVALTLGLADLGAAITLDAVTGALANFADAAVSAALHFALFEAAQAGRWSGRAETSGFFVLAMGKHGSHELNYSSDIDLITLFDPGASGLAQGVEPSTFWVRIVRTLVMLLQERTADGYVFRTDLRLRPDPGATPVALSAPAALLYYESMGQNWERAAMIKARACAGDIPAGEAFLADIAPFVWRKYLDFAAIADIHSIKRQVHAQRGHDEVRVLGHDIKRGRGGIREIEFFVQTQQLIAGGRDRALRGRGTRAMLAELAAKGWIDEGARAELDGHYEFLRNVEHRLQMVRDEQTHVVPSDPEGFARIARLMGFREPGEFEAALRSVLDAVARRTSDLFTGAQELSTETGSLVFTGGDDDPETLESLRRLGFKDPQNVTATVRAWHFGRFAAMRSTAARESLTEITPALLSAFARGGNPDAALRAFDSLLKALPAGAQLFALLTNNRHLLDLLATILSAAPRLAQMFTRRPHVVDALIDPASPNRAMTAHEVSQKLSVRLAETARFEAALDQARLVAAEQRFMISVGLLNGTISPAQAARRFSDLAEAVVGALFDLTLAEFERQHGRLPAGQAALLAFGRLGSREMTAGSDLDLIVIYDHAEDAAMSDGQRPLAPSQYFTRLTQRLVAALSAPTAEGVAYQVDLRLRPSGRAGPLATRLAALAHYQLNEAWTWEHMAMSRGRPIAGGAELIEQVSAVLDRIVAAPRDRETLAGDVADMRARIEREKPAANEFDVKLARGGLVDCEFAAQFLVLAGLGREAGESTAETLRRAVREGHASSAHGEVLAAAVELQGAVLQVLRIAEDKAFDPATGSDALKMLLASFASDEASEGTGEVLSFDALRRRLMSAQDQARAALEAVLGRKIG
jgi:glutamate-ammonia-ligase adenylyltransferase